MKPTVEEDIQNSNLANDLKKAHLAFCRFLIANGFFIEVEDDGNGWKIMDGGKCVGHTNYANPGIWLDTADFGDSADAGLKEFAWAHVRTCEHFASGGKQCGCGCQPGFDRMIFGKKYPNLCFAHLEFLNPDTETIGNIEKLMELYKNKVQGHAGGRSGRGCDIKLQKGKRHEINK